MPETVANKSEYDVVILGGGPAGMSALLWAGELALDAVLLERERELGGQLLRVFGPVSNYPGIEAANGIEVRDRFAHGLARIGDRIETGTDIVKADLMSKTLTAADGSKFRGRAIVIATGVRRREIGIPGEREFRGHGVLDSGAKQRAEVAGKRVVIIGGGDAALENALVLAEHADKIVVVHRRRDFGARDEFLRAALGKTNIDLVTETKALSVIGTKSIEAVETENIATGEREAIAADHVLIRIGVEPNTELFRGQLEIDDAGYIRTDSRCAASLSGIYAAGDAANPTAPTIAAAVGQGSTAAKAIAAELA